MAEHVDRLLAEQSLVADFTGAFRIQSKEHS